MSYENPRIVLIGAGSAQFGYGTLGDIFQSKIFRERKAHIVLHDINPETMKAVAQTGQRFIDANNLPLSISQTLDRRAALKGADFVIISIEVGDRFELWEQDWRIPQQYGIRQVYGENGGPGGLFHSLRIIPPILEICDDVAEICPEAFIFNFSNPMSRICTTVNLKFPNLNFVGLCHEIASLSRLLPKILEMPYGQMIVRAGGLNHFSVMLEARDRETGEDLYPAVREKAPAFFESHTNMLPVPNKPYLDGEAPQEKIFSWQERGLFKVILETFGVLPITTDSHFGEYVQWAHDAVDHRGILDFYHSYKYYVMKNRPEIQMRLTERVVPIMEGIIGDFGYEEPAVNIANRGYLDDLPGFMAVEVPAIVSRSGLQGLPVGRMMPPGFAGLLQNQVGIHRLTAEAVLRKSREIALQALLVDPIVDRRKAIEKMLAVMIDLQRPYLDYLK